MTTQAGSYISTSLLGGDDTDTDRRRVAPRCSYFDDTYKYPENPTHMYSVFDGIQRCEYCYGDERKLGRSISPTNPYVDNNLVMLYDFGHWAPVNVVS